MAFKLHSLLPLLLPLIILFFLLSAAAAAAPPVLGTYHPIPIAHIKDPAIQELGDFAVSEHNRNAGVHYEFIGVVAAETQIAAGTNHRLIIVLFHRERIANYNFEAVVFVHPLIGGRSLTSFTRLTAPGPWLPIKDIDYSHAEEIGRFALSEHNQQNHDRLEFIGVVKGEYQVVAGINYRLTIMSYPPPFLSMYLTQVSVFEKPWNGFRNVTSFGQH